MRLLVSNRPLRLLVLILTLIALGACARGTRTDAARAPVDAPATFDVTLVAAKDGQFDYLDAPLTAPDLRAALNYRKEQSLPMATVLLKRGEKEKVKDVHIVALARISVALGFKAFVLEDGEVNAIRTTSAEEK